jgi:hypothetical protein
MKLAIAILAILAGTTAAHAQDRYSSTGPLTGYEAEALSEVWREIREAEDFEDINWRAHGLNRAPASADAQRFLAQNWDELRREERFTDIDWDDYLDDDYRDERSSRAERYGRVERGFPDNSRGFNDSPFTAQEAAILSRSWGQLREAARFEDIDWRAMGLSRAPGTREDRRIMAENWGELREAARFEDIDWQATTGYRPR